MNQDVKEIVKEWLESEASGNWILVLDNADNKLDFFPETGRQNAGLAEFVPPAEKGTVVITTRDYEAAFQLAGPKATLTKKSMDPTDSETLFKNYYPSGAPYHDTACNQLLEELKHLPLAVTQVAAYLEMNCHVFTPSQYLTKFKSTKDDQQRLLSKLMYSRWRPCRRHLSITKRS